MTQADIAEILNVNQTTYSRYERGDINNIPLDVLIKMALFFDTSIDYILNVTDEKMTVAIVVASTIPIKEVSRSSFQKVSLGLASEHDTSWIGKATQL